MSSPIYIVIYSLNQKMFPKHIEVLLTCKQVSVSMQISFPSTVFLLNKIQAMIVLSAPHPLNF
jgi:hypothetical protein